MLYAVVSEELQVMMSTKGLRRLQWVGIIAILLYWTSGAWLPRFALLVGLHPDAGGQLESWPWLGRALEIYHWPHFQSMRLLGPFLQPESTFFPSGWVLWLTQLIPMTLMAALWWTALRRRRHVRE